MGTLVENLNRIDKGDAKVVVQQQIDALDAKAAESQMIRPKNGERFQKKLDVKRRSLEKNVNQLQLNIDMIDMMDVDLEQAGFDQVVGDGTDIEKQSYVHTLEMQEVQVLKATVPLSLCSAHVDHAHVL